MFCPSCGTETREAIKFCKKCGTNLKRVLGVLSKGGAGNSADWNQWWLEEHQEKRERDKKKSPEEKRLEEVKAGVITASIGLALSIFLNLLFEAIANTVGGPEAIILQRIWAVGLVPLFIGLAVVFNGMFITKRIVELKTPRPDPMPQPLFAPVANTSPVQQLGEASAQPVSEFSISEPTTARLREPISIPSPRDTN
ncbi:MAG: zinc ribbon domain-containing protein [Acidobacteria bacterium]|nr:zinc ribbon domain-containing protein [Acidobacteriota bacterium]